MDKKVYLISGVITYCFVHEEMLDKIIYVLGDHWFSDDGEYNNDDIIELHEELKKIKKGKE